MAFDFIISPTHIKYRDADYESVKWKQTLLTEIEGKLEKHQRVRGPSKKEKLWVLLSMDFLGLTQ